MRVMVEVAGISFIRRVIKRFLKKLALFLTSFIALFIGIFLFSFSHLEARLSYPSITNEQNYFFHTGVEFDFSESNSDPKFTAYNFNLGISYPWLWFTSELDYTYHHYPLLKINSFSTYHNFTWSGLRVYGKYLFDMFQLTGRTSEDPTISKQQLESGLNFFYSFIFLGLQLDTIFLSEVAFHYHISLILNFYSDNQLGLMLTLRDEKLVPLYFIQFNIEKFFIRLAYNLYDHTFTFSLNFFSELFRAESELTLHPVSFTKFKNSLFLFSNSNKKLTSF